MAKKYANIVGRPKKELKIIDIMREKQTIGIPITRMGEEGLEQQRVARGKTAKLNKDRATRMETKIAKMFGENGNRVPMSGAAGAWKGDVVVEFKESPGKMLVECKLSAAYNKPLDSPMIRLNFEWLSKLQQDVFITRAKWGILVIHFHRTKEFYVITRADDFALLATTYQIPDSHIVQDILALPSVDWTVSSRGVKIRTYTIILKQLLDLLQQVGLYRAAKVNTLAGEYIILPFEHYRSLIADI